MAMFNSKRLVGEYSIDQRETPWHRRRRRVEREVGSFPFLIEPAKVKQIAHIDVLAKDLYRMALHKCPSISVDARRQEGLPCISGTRIPVHLVLWAIEQTGSIEGALKSYPDLTALQVKDALYFAETVLGSYDVFSETTVTS